MYFLLIVLGLGIGAVFLIALLIGDRKEAIAKAREQALRDAVNAANTPQEGSWPPPPTERAVPTSAAPPQPSLNVTKYYRQARYWYWVIWLSVRALLFIGVMLTWLYSKYGPTGGIILAVATVAFVVVLAVRRAKGPQKPK